MSASDLMLKPVPELAALVRGGEIRAREMVSAALERIGDLDDRVNAFVEVDAERALAAADEIEPGDERPFAGVPIAIKANTPVAGMCMNFGSRFLAGHRPGHSAYLVRRLREAGFVVVGTTNMPEFGILPTTEPRHSGATRNPWDLARTPGGSSGGSAAAVAAGMLPVAHGNDGGGSLRIPAACTGLVGLKSSRGRVSRGPDLGDSFLASDGVLTRSVAETAGLLDVLAGYEVGDATWAPRPAEAYSQAVRRDPGKLRVAITTSNPLGVDVHPECVRGARHAAQLLSSLGHEVEEAAPAWPGRDALGLFLKVFGPAISLGITYGSLLAGRAPEDDEIEPLSRAMLERADSLSSVGYLARDRAAAGRGARHRRVLRGIRPAAHARPGRAAAGDRRVPRLRRGPDGGSRPLRPLHAVHLALQRHRSAGDHAAGRVRRRRPADRRAARREAARRGHAAAGGRPDRDRARQADPGSPALKP